MKFAAKHRPLFARTCTASTAKSSGPIILQCKSPGRVSCLTCQWHCEVRDAEWLQLGHDDEGGTSWPAGRLTGIAARAEECHD